MKVSSLPPLSSQTSCTRFASRVFQESDHNKPTNSWHSKSPTLPITQADVASSSAALRRKMFWQSPQPARTLEVRTWRCSLGESPRQPSDIHGAKHTDRRHSRLRARSHQVSIFVLQLRHVPRNAAQVWRGKVWQGRRTAVASGVQQLTLGQRLRLVRHLGRAELGQSVTSISATGTCWFATSEQESSPHKATHRRESSSINGSSASTGRANDHTRLSVGHLSRELP